MKSRLANYTLQDLTDPKKLGEALKSDAYRVRALVQGAVASIPKGGLTVPQDEKLLGQAQHILNVMDKKEQGKIDLKQLAEIIKAFMGGRNSRKPGSERP